MYFKFFIDVALLLAAIAFIIGLRRLSSPDTARNGNLMAAFGMGVAVLAMLIYPLGDIPNNYAWIAGGLLVGSVVGQRAAIKVKLTAMPQLVSVFNGFGGACAVLLGFVEFYKGNVGLSSPGVGELLIIVFTVLVGSVSFTGSMLAFAKLDGRVNDRKITFNGHQYLNIILMAASFAYGMCISRLPLMEWPCQSLSGISCLH